MEDSEKTIFKIPQSSSQSSAASFSEIQKPQTIQKKQPKIQSEHIYIDLLAKSQAISKERNNAEIERKLKGWF